MRKRERARHFLHVIFLIAFGCYGSRVREEERGFLRQARFVLESEESRRRVREAIEGVCRDRWWALSGLEVGENGVRGIVESEDPRRVMIEWKCGSAKALRSAGAVAEDRRIWARGGSWIGLMTEEAVAAAEWSIGWRGTGRIRAARIGVGRAAYG
jgi:hypothetical protein